MSAAEKLTTAETLPPPAPFIKWVGGKRKLAKKIRAYAPANMTRYVEPFVGGGAVFFAMRANGWRGPARINDVNPELVATYRAVRDTPHRVIELLRNCVNKEAFYYEMRAIDTSTLSEIERARRFIFLNKTCFNGLYRENSKGKMNSPYGHNPKANWCDERVILSAHNALQGTLIEQGSFDTMGVCDGDFVYCDPPYVPVSATANFTGYSKGGFGPADQIRLRDLALKWRQYGATVVISNADTEQARALYADGFDVERVEMRRAINSDATKRGPVGELLAVAR